MTLEFAKRRTSLEKHDRELAREWLRDDVSIHAIAERYQVSQSQLNAFAVARGWPPHRARIMSARQGRLGVLKAHEDEVRGLWDAGGSMAHIARRFQVTQSTVQYFTQLRCWPPRDRGQRGE